MMKPLRSHSFFSQFVVIYDLWKHRRLPALKKLLANCWSIVLTFYLWYFYIIIIFNRVEANFLEDFSFPLTRKREDAFLSLFCLSTKNPSFHLNINSHLHDFNAITVKSEGLRNNDSHAHASATFHGSEEIWKIDLNSIRSEKLPLWQNNETWKRT